MLLGHPDLGNGYNLGMSPFHSSDWGGLRPRKKKWLGLEPADSWCQAGTQTWAPNVEATLTSSLGYSDGSLGWSHLLGVPGPSDMSTRAQMGSWGHFCDSWGERPGGREHSAAVFCLWLSPLLQRILGVGAEGPSSSFSTPCVPNPPPPTPSSQP